MLLAKGRLINDGVSKQRDDIARIDQQRENERIKNFENLANVQATTGKILHFLETEGFKLLEQGINKITEIAGTINKLTQSSLFKTFFGKSKD
jgi:membrane protein involved in colicin uptake